MGSYRDGDEEPEASSIGGQVVEARRVATQQQTTVQDEPSPLKKQKALFFFLRDRPLKKAKACQHHCFSVWGLTYAC